MLLSFLLFAILVLVTYYVGYCGLQCLQHEDEFDNTISLHAMALPTGLGIFSLTTGPLLLLHQPYAYASWAALLAAASAVAAYWLLAKPIGLAPTFVTQFPDSASPRLNRAAIVAIVACAISTTAFATHEPTRKLALVACVLSAFLLSAISFSLLWLQNAIATSAADNDSHESRPQRFEWMLAGLFALTLVVGSAIWVREDADDVLYLSEALWLQNSPAMGATSPVHRGENLPSTLIYAWQTFELWGGMLAHNSGLPVLAAFRTALPPVFVISSLLLYVALLRKLVPAYLLPFAMCGLLAYVSFGTTSLFAGNSYFLVRAAQGKTWLIHIGFPALTLATLCFLQRPKCNRLATVVLIGFACLGFAPSAVFTCPILLATLTLAAWMIQPRPRVVKAGAGIAIAILPFVAFGAYVMLQQPSDEVNTMAYEKHPDAATWIGANLFFHLGLSHGGGAIELCLMLICPLLFAASRSNQGSEYAAYPSVFTVALAATFLNPIVFPLLVAAIGYNATSRILWVIPFPLLAAIMAAWMGRNLHAKTRCIAMLLIPLAMMAMGGRIIWSPQALPNSTGPVPYCANNPFKMPSDLLELARTLEQEPLGTNRRILCSSRVASHLSPYHLDFNFVYARSFQTEAALAQAGHMQELTRRRRLATEFLAGEQIADAQDLLDAEYVYYIIMPTALASLADSLRDLPFQHAGEFGEWQLWKRTSDL